MEFKLEMRGKIDQPRCGIVIHRLLDSGTNIERGQTTNTRTLEYC